MQLNLKSRRYYTIIWQSRYFNDLFLLCWVGENALCLNKIIIITFHCKNDGFFFYVCTKLNTNRWHHFIYSTRPSLHHFRIFIFHKFSFEISGNCWISIRLHWHRFNNINRPEGCSNTVRAHLRVFYCLFSKLE